jgi:murein DD-endopeptidase MepM/ murein hydrolase activator NlpD
MKKSKSSLYLEKLKKKFQLSIFNESTLESVFSLRASRLDGILMATSVLIVLFLVFLLLLRFTPLSSFLPKYMEPKFREKLIYDTYRVDSMTEVLNSQTKYVDVIKGIFSGDIPSDLTDEKGRKIPLDTLVNKHLELMKATEAERKFREKYESSEKSNLSTLVPQATKSELLFYQPVKGRILSRYNPQQKKYGMDFAIDDRQAIQSVLDGTVIFAAYVSEFQYVIQVQHINDFISVYKFNSELLKKQGDRVKAGEVIAIVSKSSDPKIQSHLYFELWQKGFALNPEDYILF